MSHTKPNLNPYLPMGYVRLLNSKMWKGGSGACDGMNVSPGGYEVSPNWYQTRPVVVASHVPSRVSLASGVLGQTWPELGVLRLDEWEPLLENLKMKFGDTHLGRKIE